MKNKPRPKVTYTPKKIKGKTTVRGTIDKGRVGQFCTVEVDLNKTHKPKIPKWKWYLWYNILGHSTSPFNIICEWGIIQSLLFGKHERVMEEK
jgi:hypothetical protein